MVGVLCFLAMKRRYLLYIDQMVGNAIMMFMKDAPLERPQTHDLFGHVLEALGAKVQRVIINDFKDEVYFGRLIPVSYTHLTLPTKA